MTGGGDGNLGHPPPPSVPEAQPGGAESPAVSVWLSLQKAY